MDVLANILRQSSYWGHKGMLLEIRPLLTRELPSQYPLGAKRKSHRIVIFLINFSLLSMEGYIILPIQAKSYIIIHGKVR